MTLYTAIEYPVLVYKNPKTKNFIANCINFNLLSFGKTEQEAMKNIEKTIVEKTKNSTISLKKIDSLS